MACLKKFRKSQKGLIFKKIQFPGLRSFSIMPIPVKNKPFWARRMHECISGDPNRQKITTIRILLSGSRLPAPPCGAAPARCAFRDAYRLSRIRKKSNVWHFLAAAFSGFGNDFLRSLRMENLRCPDNRVDLRKLKKNFKDTRKCIC